MGLSRSILCPSQALFHDIVPGAVVTPIGQITLPVTFETWKNFCTKHLQFEVANLKTTYGAVLGRLTLTKFMAIPHYSYLVLKMSGPDGVISIRGDIKRAYDCDSESCEMADMFTTSVELKKLKKALTESPRTQSFPRPRHPRCPSSRMTHSARRSRYPWRSPLRSLAWGIIWTPNRNSCSPNSCRKIGTTSHGSLLTRTTSRFKGQARQATTLSFRPR
jgi:hypothetical protein